MFAATAADVTQVVVDGRVVVHQRRRRARSAASSTAAIGRLWHDAALVVTNIGELVTNDPERRRPARRWSTHAALVVEGGKVAWVGPAADAPAADEHVDAGGRAVLPGFVDSHSHLVFAGDRAQEFAARMAGTPYAAGGIRTTVAATRAATDEQLTATSPGCVAEMRRQGTTTVEIKSGYGLTVLDEARSLAVARQFTEETTFLGAHVVPAEYADDPAGVRRPGHRPDARGRRAARPLDRRVLRARRLRRRPGPRGPRGRRGRRAAAAGCTPTSSAPARASGSPPSSGSPRSTTAPTSTTPTSTRCATRGTIATLLPGVEFSTRQPYPDARRLLDAGVRVALASDCNPGSCYTSSIPLCIALAVREMGMTPAEAVHAATYVGAAGARPRRRRRASAPGKRADLVVLDAPSHVHLAYRPGVPLVAGHLGRRAAGRRPSKAP